MAWQDGTAHLVMSPLELMQRRAALVARPLAERGGPVARLFVTHNWAKLLKRVVDLDLENCPNCGGELRMLAAILEQLEIEKILTHLGRQARAPPRAPARGQAMQAA